MPTKALSLVIVLSTLVSASCRDGAGGPEAAASARVAPPGAEELSLIAPLTRGADLGGFTIRDVRGVERGSMLLVCAKGSAVVRLEVALATDDGPAAPATAGRYAIFYSLRGAAPEDGERLAKKLAEVIKGHPDVAPPKGMTPFAPKPKPGITL